MFFLRIEPARFVKNKIFKSKNHIATNVYSEIYSKTCIIFQLTLIYSV